MKAIQFKLWIYPLLFSIAASLISLPVAAEQSTIIVNMTGLRSQSGTVLVCLWRQQDKEFPICSKTSSMQYIAAEPSGSNATVTFQNIPSGDYAISAFHDENQNGRLDRGFMGRPEEGIGFSNMTQGVQGRPSFDRAKFAVSGEKTISISLVYFGG